MYDNLLCFIKSLEFSFYYVCMYVLMLFSSFWNEGLNASIRR